MEKRKKGGGTSSRVFGSLAVSDLLDTMSSVYSMDQQKQTYSGPETFTLTPSGLSAEGQKSTATYCPEHKQG